MDKKWEKIISGFDDRSIKTLLAEKQTNKKHLIKKIPIPHKTLVTIRDDPSRCDGGVRRRETRRGRKKKF